MFQGVMDMVDGDKLVPFIAQFYGSLATYLWEDDDGNVHHVRQGGDPLMPMLFSLGHYRTLFAVKAKLRKEEELFAFLDDIYVVCRPERVPAVFRALEVQLQSRTCIRIQQRKTKIWNEAGTEQPSRQLRALKPEAVVWRGDRLPSGQQGLTVVGARGPPRFCEGETCRKGGRA